MKINLNITKQNLLIGVGILLVYFVLIKKYNTGSKKEGRSLNGNKFPLNRNRFPLSNHKSNNVLPTQGIYQPEYRYAYRNTPDSYGWYAKSGLWSLTGSLHSTDLNDDTILNLYRRSSRVYTGYYEYRVETPESNVYLDTHTYKLLKHDDELYVPGLEGTGIWTVVLNEW